MSDLRINHLETKAELLRAADAERERVFEVARRAYEEKRDALFRNLDQAQIGEVVRLAFGSKGFGEWTEGGES